MTLEQALQHGIANQALDDTIVLVEEDAAHHGRYAVTSEDGGIYVVCESLADVYRVLARQAPGLSPTGWGWFNPMSATSSEESLF